MATIQIDFIQVTSLQSPIPVLDNVSVIEWAVIGSKLTIRIFAVLSGDHDDGTPFEIRGAEIWFNPAIFNFIGERWFPKGTFPRSSWYVEIPDTDTPSGTYPMALQGGNLAFESNRNLDMNVIVINQTEISFKLEFYMTADVPGFTIGQLIPSNSRFLKNHFLNLNQLDNNFPSVYNQTKDLSFIVAIEKNNETIIAEGAQKFAGNWYGETKDGNIHSPEFSFWQGATQVDGISRFDNTTLRLTLTNDNDVNPDSVRLLYFREVAANKGTFTDDIELVDFAMVNDPVGSAPYAGTPFRRPSTWSTAGNETIINIQVDKNQVDNRPFWVVVIIGYDDIEPTLMSSIPVQPLLPVVPPADPVDLVIESYFSDLNQQLGGKVKVITAQDRIEDEVRIDRVAYDFDVQGAGYGAGFDNDFLRFNMRVIDQNTNEVLYFTDRQRLPNQPFANDKVFTFTNINGDYWIVKWNHRIPGHTESGDLIDWSGRDVWVNWEFFFTYPQDNFQVRYTFQQEMEFEPYENEKSPADAIESVVILNGSDGLQAVNLCDEEHVIVEVTLAAALADPDDYRLIALVDREPFGNQFTQEGGTREFEDWNGATGVLQREQSPIIWADEFFTLVGTSYVARFAVDVSDWDEGEQYMISAIAKKEVT